jgi:carboxypeptidase C (cathepsin A)
MFKYAFASTLAVAAMGKPEEERVSELPMMGTFDQYGMFSGFLDIPDTSKKIHYLFVESANEPSTDPLVIWFNGGPGCSSMLGFMQENGPFRMDSGTGEIHASAEGWNREANVLYIEQPAGVGFSYCEGEADCSFTDESSAADNLTVVLEWYKKFPEFKPNDLYISGESYAGIYVPYLSNAIYDHNQAANDDDFKPPLKGFMVGNGVTNWTYDTNTAFLDMAYWHSIMSTELHDKITAEECDFSGPNMSKASKKCLAHLVEFDRSVSDINIYDIFGTCWGSGPFPQMYQSKKGGFTQNDYTPWLKRPIPESDGMLRELPPCTYGSGLLDYLNLDVVRQALHVPNNVQAWDLCTTEIDYTTGEQGSQWIYEKLQGKIRMLHYSGDTDGAVPTIGTENWIATLGWDTTKDWAPYMYAGQVAGYSETYTGDFTFATVHGAGHMAPQFKPPQTYKLIFSWLQKKNEFADL